MRSLLVAVVVLFLAVPVMAMENENTTNSPNSGDVPPTPGAPLWEGARDVLYDNGPFVTCPGCGMGGADESAVQDLSLGMSVYGFGHQITYDYRLSDDFTVPAGGWTLTNMTFFAYQTGSSTTSTITDYYVQILDDNPALPSANVVWGDLATNVLESSAWSNCYRVLESSPGATNRPIMACVCTTPVALDPGTYWYVEQAAGSLSSGPWAPPITILGQATTGDALQYVSGVWDWLVDSGAMTQQGMPFIVEGTAGGTPTETSTWGFIKSLFR